ncbi:putative ABC transport system permease protein [Palleronia marisminoris]|uniref:FtsX-like permease family protein n=1 Tax=Palleronia marisminoris TaxID=315423 RepID=A0A1Y5SWI3_9RHOB|nr:FtsX-like permease family protein [Palleronia marisminoris]SFG98660.1 putative ABC transport system permease protein [Palleronia marisminoris]SLN48171.1 FtsX-like permease family protein [Palleronia marisminoris]
MNPALNIARRELRNGFRHGLRGFRVFLACLALGIAAIAAVGSVREAITEGLAREGATLLGGDASVEFTYRFATEAERAALADLGEVSEIVDFRSMVRVGEDRALTEIKAVDDAYPIYGDLRLDPPQTLAQATAGDPPGAAMDPVLADRLGLDIGETFTLGEKTFRLTARIVAEPDNAAGGFELGPRTLILTEDLEGTGLIQPGTLYETEYRLRLPEGTDLDAAEENLAAVMPDEGYRWRDRRNGAPGIQAFVERLSAFLVLVGLAGLAVGGIGVASAVRAHMVEKTATIATLKTLGAEARTLFLAFALQIGAVTALAVVLGLALGGALPLVFAPLIKDRLPIPAAISVYPLALVEAALYGTLAAALFTLWPLAKAQDIRAAALFREAGGLPGGLPRRGYLLATGLLLLTLVAAAALLSGIPTLTLYTAGGLLAAFLALLGTAWAVRRTARWLGRLPMFQGRSSLRMALGAVGGPSGEAGAVVLSLGLGLTVLAAVGQIDANLRAAIQRDLPEVAPAYFMVDIQPDQIDTIRALEDDPQVERIEAAPMLRGIITEINGQDAETVAGEHWVLRGDRGVTYAPTPPPDTTITAGEWWPEGYDGPNQVSFAAEEAAELGLELGDSLTVNVLGRDIEGEITSFREVDFSNAGIGFVLSMNPAALQGAPHTWIATIYAAPEAEARILRDIAGQFPNITAIRVRDAIDRVSEILAGVAAAITYGASATLVTGAVVLIGAAAAGTRARTYEASILKTVGASRTTILTSFALRWAILGLVAGLVATVAGATAGWGVSVYIMETSYRFAPLSALTIIAGGVSLTLLAGLAFAWGPLAARPARILRAQD